ncbi:MAG TPA: TonB family protein [Cellvibrionaceae bacterium]
MKASIKPLIQKINFSALTPALKIITLFYSLIILPSCTQTTVEPDKRCSGGLCGIYFSQQPITPEEIAKLRAEGKRVPLYNPPLIYPEFLHNQGIEGAVTLSFDIDKEGNTFNIKVTCSEPNTAFNMYAIEFIERKKFEPSNSITKGETLTVKYRISKMPMESTKCSKSGP